MTTTKATINVKIDKSVKERVTQLLESMGLDHTTAIDMYYRQIITERQIPFQPRSGLSLDEQLIAAINAKNIPRKAVSVNAQGQIIVDKESDPEFYDWAVNG